MTHDVGKEYEDLWNEMWDSEIGKKVWTFDNKTHIYRKVFMGRELIFIFCEILTNIFFNCYLLNGGANKNEKLFPGIKEKFSRNTK